MPPWKPISRRKLVQALRALGFEGPPAGGKHEYMIRNATTLRIPNPHAGDIGVDLLSRLLKQAGVERADWEKV